MAILSMVFFWDPLLQAERCRAAEEGERRAAAAAQQAKLAVQQAEEAQFSRLAISSFFEFPRHKRLSLYSLG